MSKTQPQEVIEGQVTNEDPEAPGVPIDFALEPYASRAQLEAFARRIQYMLPGGDKLSLAAAVALAQYAVSRDANPFAGEVWAWIDNRDRLVLMDGYKLWARWIEEHDPDHLTVYEEVPVGVENVAKGDYAYWCWYLRGKHTDTAMRLVEAKGIEWSEAIKTLGHQAVGIVIESETKTRNPPKGWSWEEVARKRAWMNAAKRVVGAPSPQQIANARTGALRTAGDWNEAATETEGVLISPEAMGQLASMIATERERAEERAEMTPEQRNEMLVKNVTRMRGEEAGDLARAGVERAQGRAESRDAKSRPAPQARSVEDVVKVLRKAGGWQRPEGKSYLESHRPPDDEQRPPNKRGVQRLAVLMETALRGPVDTDEDLKNKRYLVNDFVFGVTSGKNMTNDENMAMLGWLESEGGSWHAHETTAEECRQLYNAALETRGQQQLEIEGDQSDA